MNYNHSTTSSDINQHTTSCYFSYTPHPSTHWSLETPLSSPSSFSAEVTADPNNPLLAARQPCASLTPPITMDASRLLQLQTAAAHPHRHSQSGSGYSSGRSSTSSESSSPTRPAVRCSRCQTDSGSMVKYSMNSYYCSRCAGIVGYGG
jgi:hypothetical protein